MCRSWSFIFWWFLLFRNVAIISLLLLMNFVIWNLFWLVFYGSENFVNSKVFLKNLRSCRAKFIKVISCCSLQWKVTATSWRRTHLPPPLPPPTRQSRKHISWSKVSCCFSTEGILENFDIFLENTSYQTKHLLKIDFMPAIVATGSCCLNLIKTLMISFVKSGDDKSSLLSTLVSFGTLFCSQILLSFLCQHFLYVANQLIFWGVLFK